MTPSLRIRVSWLGDVIRDVVLSPARDYTLGEDDDADFVMPREVLGRARFPLIRVSGGRVSVGVALGEGPSVVPVEPSGDGDLGFFQVQRGQRFAQSFGDFVIDVEAGDAVRSPVRRFFVRLSGLGYFGGSLSLSAGVLGSAAHFAAPPAELAEAAEREQVMLMQQYLLASAEREARPGSGDRGGEGALALGHPSSKGTRGRYAIQGPASGSGPKLSRAAGLAQAREFGMIGLVAESLGGGEPTSARGDLWGSDEGQGLDSGNSGERPSGEDFADHGINPVVDPAKDRFSTFAVDVDTGSYFFVKRRLEEGAMPPLASVRPEEMLNAFDYGYAGPEEEPGDSPFRVHLDAAPSPFDAGRHFLRVAVQARRVAPSARPPLHLTYLVDTSGSMRGRDRLELAQHSLRLLTRRLRPGDTVALCTYAGGVSEILAPTPAERTQTIDDAIEELSAGGSTAMASGIELAYSLAERSLRRGHQSRVVVLSDGDANVGPKSPDEILALISKKRQQGITLSTIGFGRGNYRDSTMERLADAGDGNYSYVGSERDAERVFGAAADGMIHVVARDVKIQVEMNPEAVAEYRLVGYENRDVADGDFRKDEVDGGEIGSGHSVTALYEVVLRRTGLPPVKVALRHKRAEDGPSGRALESEARMQGERVFARFADAPASFRFAVSVAAFAEVLRGSPRALSWPLARVAELARASGEGREERVELAGLVDRARALSEN